MSTIPRTSGIYQIRCIPSGKLYIGSAVNLRTRWNQHRSYLRRNAHNNPVLQHAWNSHGEEAFEFTVIELVLAPVLIEREQYWLDRLRPFAPSDGFNVHRDARSPLGMKRTPEQRARMSAARAGKTFGPLTEAHRAAVSQSQIGKVVSHETRLRISEAQRGKKRGPHTAEHRARLSAANAGKHRERLLRPDMQEASRVARCKEYRFLDPDGRLHIVTNGLHGFCSEHGLGYTMMHYLSSGRVQSYRGWTCPSK